MGKFQAKRKKVKTLIQQHKRQAAILLIAIFAVIVLIIASIYQNTTQKGMGVITPELAKAMTYDQVQEGNEAVEGTDNVKFDAFFLRDINGDGYAEGIRGTSKQIGQEDTLYMELNVQTAGYLKDAKIEINGENFYLQTALPKDEELKDNYIGSNIQLIEFNQINNGTQKLLTGIVRSGDYSYDSKKSEAIGNNVNNYSKVNSVTLTGTYVSEDGTTETPITKTVEFSIDWYGTTKAEMPTYLANVRNLNQEQDINTAINEEEGTFTVDFTVGMQEVNHELNLSKAYIEGEIPEISGYAPTKIEVLGTNVTYTYDEQTRKFTAQREAVTDENGNITSQAYEGIDNYTSSRYLRYNKFNIKITYPIQAYEEIGSDTVEYKLPVRGYYEGYNNPSEEFTNPYRSNIVTATFMVTIKNPDGEVARFDVYVGDYISKPTWRYVISKQKPIRIYNGTSEEETNDTYQVRWYAYTGTEGNSTGLVMKETQDGAEQVADQFIKTDGSQESMENVTRNVGIGFSGANNMLKEDGWIKVYDEDTGDLLVTFTQNDWSKYTQSNPYRYEVPVKHIRIETSETNASTSMYIHHVKELDDEFIITNYTREQFDEFQYIKSTLVGYLGENYINTDTHQANYEAPYSLAEITLSNNTLSTQTTEKNLKITINATKENASNQIGWIDGSFLVKLPEEILTAEINNVEINNSQIALTSYELIEQEGLKFIKINTKNQSQTEQTYSITIDVDLTPDPRISTVTRQVELYASNEEAGDYYYKAQDIYDVNDNLNTTEQVNKTTASISLVSPNSLLTNQIGSNYDNKGSEVISPQIADIKPTYAVIDQEEEQTAQIGVQIRNNYASTISEIKILGKIPFEGNTYVLSGGDLGSTFTAKMQDTGIEVPEELQAYVTVYYSENENPTQDLETEENGWKTADEVANWDWVKTYLIDLGNYVMPTGEEYIFNYTIKIPTGLEFNQVAFSHHGIYFSLDTEQGKYRTQTEPNKLGFRIAEKFNLTLTKTQTGKDKLIPGATYSITEITTNEEGEEVKGEAKTGVTNAQGQLTINNLYAEKTYEIQEIKTPSDYELNSDIIRFIGHVDEEGTLTIDKIKGTTKEEFKVIKNKGENYKVTVDVEDEVKASIKITKKEQGTENNLQGIRYKLTGYNLAETGKTVTTNINGEATLNGLSIGQEYTLQETKAEGYYLASPIKFKVVNNNGNYTVEQLQEEGSIGTITNQTITEEDGIPTINIVLEDEKIPTYDLQIIKIKKTTESTVSEDELIAKAETSLADTEIEYLEGVRFKLYKGTEEIGAYITDSTGTVTIPGLYQYETEKDIDQTYTLKEVFAPEGYAKVKDISFKVENKDGTLTLTKINEEGEELEGENYTVEGNTVKLTIEDSPSFKLIKKDAETQQPIANVKFAIYNVDNGEVPATNSKGEIIGTKETIDGKEYYTISTDENGEITADLTEGLYKAVEVEAPEKYDITDQTYYFGIGASREGKKVMQAEWGNAVGGSSNETILTVAPTEDGGYIAGGHFNSETLNLENGEILTNDSNFSYTDGMLIKYDEKGIIQWAKKIGGIGNDEIEEVIQTSDNGYVVGGRFQNEINLENDITLKSNGYYDGMIIKYDENGVLQWAKSVGDSAEEYIYSIAEGKNKEIIAVGGTRSLTIELENGEILTNKGTMDGMMLKYDETGVLLWANLIGGDDYDCIDSVDSTSDGGFFVGGRFSSSSLDLENEITLNGNSDSDGMIIKYDEKGIAQWAKTIGETGGIEQVESVIQTNDGGYVVGGWLQSGIIDLGNGVILDTHGSADGMIIKYNENGVAQWANTIGGTSSDYIYSVSETSDGGIIAGGMFYANSINLGNGIILTRNGSSEGMIIKYDEKGIVQWAKTIGGNGSDYIYSVAETIDEGYVAGGYFYNGTIELENEIIINNKGANDGVIIKYTPVEVPEAVIKQAKAIGGNSNDTIQSVTATSDGGYIVGGYFQSSSIDLENEITITKHTSNDGMIIKYDKNGIIEWAKVVGGDNNDFIYSVIETRDRGYIAVGHFGSHNIDLGNEITISQVGLGSFDGMIIKYDEDGNAKWAKVIGGDNNDYITSVAETSDGEIILGGYFLSDSIDLENGVTLSNSGVKNEDGMVIKCDENGSLKWAKTINGTNSEFVYSVDSTTDGGVIVGGTFGSSNVDLGEGVILTNHGSTGSTDGLIIKYDENGNLVWTKAIGGTTSEAIYSVDATNDEGIIVGGNFYGEDIDLENGITLVNNGLSDGMIIKYDSNGNTKWAKTIGGTSTEYVYSVKETRLGEYVVGGYFNSSRIDLGNELILTVNGNYDGMVIKYDTEGKPLCGKAIGGSNSDEILSVTEVNDGSYIAGGQFNSSSIDLGNGKTLINNGSLDAMILKINAEMGVPEIQEITVENNIKEFEITTNVKEIDGIKGGSISGEDNTPYETVKYQENSTKEIIITPDENYEIIAITINGEEYPFTANPDGTYQMPQFENMIEDKHIEVTFSLKDQKIIINKVEDTSGEILPGATFQLDQIEERNQPENVIGTLTENGAEYAIADETNEITGIQGELTANGDYYFVQNDNGTLTPTNSKTYQVTQGGTAGISGTANSYIPINLEGKEGQYVVVVNAQISSKSSDYGYVTITENTTAPTYSSTTGRFVYLSGTSGNIIEPTDYTSMALEGGKTYYLHLGYRKSSSTSSGDDQIVINSIKVYQAKTTTYNFIENEEGGYESNNQGKNNTVANSYILIDLKDYTGKYNLTVNAQISSQSGYDYGYATVTSSVTAPTYTNSTGRFIYISGEQESQDYTTVLQGGQEYYLHLGYYKSINTSSGEDTFKVNRIELTLNDSELYHTQITTNSEGQAITQIPFGKYLVTETQAPEGYEKLENPITIEFRADGNSVITNENNVQATVNEQGEFVITNYETSKIIVHHYLKDENGNYTTTKLAEDDLLEGKIGETYTTSPKLDIEGYELEKDENGAYKLPQNATGTYTPGTIEVNYYYEEKEIPLIVHHYIEGTTTKVPLKDGSVAQDEENSGKEGDTYQTSEIADSLLSDDYELATKPENAQGFYSGEEVIVNYYYKRVERQVRLTKYDEDGKTPLAGVKFKIQEKGKEETAQEYTTNSKGQIEVTLPSGEYIAEEIEVPEGYEVPTNPQTEFTITKQTTMEELEITNTKKKGTVITHHYIQGTTDKVPLKTGGTAEDAIQTGNVGDVYATKEAENIADNYQFVEVQGNTSGEIVEGTTEVIYYYQIKDPSIITPFITKESNIQKVTNQGQIIDYTINYQATIKEYIGKATITIIDKLPYEIDETKAYNLDNGTYNKDARTITWVKTIENIDTYTNNAEAVNITKEISLAYKDVDTTKNTIENEVTGTINLKTPEKEETVETTKEIPAEYFVNIQVTKQWDDTNNTAQRRPSGVEIVVKNGTEEVGRKEVNEGTEWKATFENLPKYDDVGQEIQYTITEKEINENDLKFYSKGTIEGNIENGYTITNKFQVPNETVEITVNKVWIDNETQAQRRPESIIIHVKAENADGKLPTDVIDTATLTTATQSSYTFTNLPKYNSNGDEIVYTVEEAEKTSGDLDFYQKAEGQVTNVEGEENKKQATITNTFTRPQDKIEITINKNWEDNQDFYQKRPETIILQIKTDETAETGEQQEKIVEEQEITKDENWTYTFKNLDKYDDNGQEIQYKIDEREETEGDLFNYTKEIGELEQITEQGNKQGTITNKMTKIPGKVVVKYVDKATGEEISYFVEKEGIVGEEFDVTEDKKEIPGYTLIEEPENPKGTYEEETQEKVYYYAKNTKVIVKYLEKGTNKILTEEPQYEKKGYEGQPYATKQLEIEGYTFIEDTGNTSGTMTRDEITIIYYYAQNTEIVVKYLDKYPDEQGNHEELAPTEKQEGYEGKHYETEQKEISGYTFIEDTQNTEGEMTKEPIEVIYYYAKNTKVIVKYLEKGTNKVLTEEPQYEKEGYEGLPYATRQLEIEGYTFVEDTGNTSGTMTKETIEIIYYYAQNTKATVQHIDRETGEILKEETEEGKVGDRFETHAEDFEEYVLVESPEQPNIIMDATGEQIVKYYYAHISAGLIEKHIDEITGELLYSEEHQGNEGDYYHILPKTFDGYDLVTEDKEGNSRLPENAEGKMTKDLIEVKYYYIKKAKVIVEHIDQTPGHEGEKLAEDETIEGHENDEYETSEKQIDGYNYIARTDNWKGIMEITKNEDGSYQIEIKVTYYYKKQAGGVREKHIDIHTDEVLAEETHTGNVGDDYDIPSREFENYEVVEDRLPANSKGQMAEEEIEVVYYYRQLAQVKVEYIDIQTGEKLTEDEIIKGYVGDEYETEEKQFDQYDLVEQPSNATGKMEQEEIVVQYYYNRKAEVEVNYIEKDTGYELQEKETIKGYVGDDYETEEKEIPYYKLVEKTENDKGQMETEKITVIYYYEKLTFNLGVDKWVANVEINGNNETGQSIESKDEIYKVEIHRKKVTTAEVEITYKIRITNTGEIEGQVGKITEILPSGFEYKQEDNTINWEQENGILTTDALEEEIIQPGENKEIEITLRWIRGEENFGQKINTVVISELNNPAGYTDINQEDNKSSSEMLLTVATGLEQNNAIIVVVVLETILVVSIGLFVIYKKKEKR